MRPPGLWHAHSPLLLLAALCWSSRHLDPFLSLPVEAITIKIPEDRLKVPVEQDALFSVDIMSQSTPYIQWTFLSARDKRRVATWEPGLYRNISELYTERIFTYNNGSFTLLDVRVTDSGYYELTVTDSSGSSQQTAIVLTVTEVLYEDIQYLAVFVAVLGAMAGFLMVSLWVLDKLYKRAKEWYLTRNMPAHDATELERL